MSCARLSFRGRNLLACLWFSIRLLLLQDPKSCLGQMPSHCSDGLLVALAGSYPLIQTMHMPLGQMPVIQADDVGCLQEGPFQIAVHIWAQLPVVCLASGGVHPRCSAGVRGQVCSAGEAIDFSDFQQDDRPQDEAYGGQAHDQRQLRGGGKDLSDSAFKLLDLLAEQIGDLRDAQPIFG